MSRRLQFSLGRLLSAISLFALSIWLLRVAIDSADNRLAAVAAFPIVLSSAIGRLFGRGLVVATSVVLIYCALALVVIAICCAFAVYRLMFFGTA